MSTQEYKLGKIVQVGGKDYLVVRIDESTTLFEEPGGECFTLRECYAQLRGGDGEVQFESFYEEIQPHPHPEGTIQALEPAIWKKSTNIHMKGISYGKDSETPRTEGDR